MKTLSSALFIALCVASAAEAAPKVTLKVTASKGSAGTDASAAKFFKSSITTWVPCTSVGVELGGKLNLQPVTKALVDSISIDISVTNEDKVTVGEPTTAKADGVMDYDLYVLLINHAATGIDSSIINTPEANEIKVWAAKSDPFVPGLVPYLTSNEIGGSDFKTPPTTNWYAARFMSAVDFGSSTAYKTTLFGGSTRLDLNGFPQGSWSVVAFLVDGANTTALTPSQMQNTANWAAMDIANFVLGTPFTTSFGTSGNGTCK